MELLASAIGYTALILLLAFICLLLLAMIYAVVEAFREQRIMSKKIKINDEKLVEALKNSIEKNNKEN